MTGIGEPELKENSIPEKHAKGPNMAAGRDNKNVPDNIPATPAAKKENAFQITSGKENRSQNHGTYRDSGSSE